MVIGHRYKYLFIEIPHTGSHSISGQLCEHYGGEKILRKHANLTQFWRQASAAEKGFFKFAAVRNPLDAIVTDYFKLKSNHKGQYTNPEQRLGAGEFGHVTDEHLAAFRFIHDNEADFAQFFKRFRTSLYHNWFLVGHGRLDFVIRFENIAEDYTRALELIGVDEIRPLPHVNPTKGKRNFEEFYTPEIREQAVRCIGPFMRRWGYEFPAGWTERRIPFSSRLRFEAKERAVNALARVVSLDPDSRPVRMAKKVVDSVM